MAPLPLTVVIINFRTADLLEQSAGSLRRLYPTVPLLLIDNGSNDGSAAVMENIRKECPSSTVILLNPANRHHGPAMDQGIRHASTPFVLMLDSDCVLQRSGLLEAMLERLDRSPRAYAAGRKVFMNKRGFDVPERPGAFPYIRPICMLLRRDRYLALPPFRRHGAPCLDNMRAAVAQGFLLVDFPIEEYVVHRGRGTAGRVGYNLGWRGKLNHLLNRIGL